MRPIDTLTGIPKSPEVARVADSTQKQGSVQSQIQLASFAKEITERATTVSESPHVSEARIDPDSKKKKSSADKSFSGSDKEDEHRDTAQQQSPHPSKGKILDIRGA